MIGRRHHRLIICRQGSKSTILGDYAPPRHRARHYHLDGVRVFRHMARRQTPRLRHPAGFCASCHQAWGASHRSRPARLAHEAPSGSAPPVVKTRTTGPQAPVLDCLDPEYSSGLYRLRQPGLRGNYSCSSPRAISGAELGPGPACHLIAAAKTTTLSLPRSPRSQGRAPEHTSPC